MQENVNWAWLLIGKKGEVSGYVHAIDPRDALSRALTSETASGRLLGEEQGIPVEVLQQAPCNADEVCEVSGEGFSLKLRKVVCPAEARYPGDIVGCGSANVVGPDHEGLFDCCDCGIFFNPQAEAAAGAPAASLN